MTLILRMPGHKNDYDLPKYDSDWFESQLNFDDNLSVTCMYNNACKGGY